MFPPLRYMLDRIVTTGRLNLIDAAGCNHGFGDHGGPPLVARIADRRTELHLAYDPVLAAGEAYMDGRLQILQGTIYDLFELVAANLASKPGAAPWPRLARAIERTRHLTRRLHHNPKARARQNVAHHYDLDGSLYDLFLDKDRQYSCAYFADAAMSLDAAQAAKKRHIAAKLALSDGMKVLDIGSGWGGLALYLAKTAHVSVTGVTLSEKQLQVSRARARAMGLAKAVRFELCDYRDLDARFDRIVSVGMFEHVGLAHYGAFFETVDRLLEPGGAALLHTIGRSDRPAATNPFIAKYIFPGGYTPALSEILPPVEKAGLVLTDLETLRLHYAMTLRHWRQRFRSQWSTAVARFGERFCRMWEAYLAMAEVGFRHQHLVVFQLQLAKDQTALPLTRDYTYEAEHALALHDEPRAPAAEWRIVGSLPSPAVMPGLVPGIHDWASGSI